MVSFTVLAANLPLLSSVYGTLGFDVLFGVLAGAVLTNRLVVSKVPTQGLLAQPA